MDAVVVLFGCTKITLISPFFRYFYCLENACYQWQEHLSKFCVVI